MPSDKIKSQDLSYDSAVPPFLQRLQDQRAGRGDTDRHEFQTARPKREKNPDDDDGPTVVDESGENISKDEFAKLTAAEEDGGNVTGEVKSTEPKASGALPDGETGVRKGKETVTDGTTVKKRKAVKVVGEDELEEGAAEDKTLENTKKPPKKVKKKAKVKLNFGDEEEDGS